MQDTSDQSALGIRAEVARLKRERIVEAAVDLFYERGYENTTLDAVAERLEVTKPFIYAHFGSKPELLAEICARGISSSLDAINRVVTRDIPVEQRLKEIGCEFVTAVLRNQKHIAIFTREEKNLLPDGFERINAMRREFDKKLTDILEEGNRSGKFDIEDTHLAALAIGGLVSWSYVWYRPFGRLSVEQVASRLSVMILNLAGAKD